MKHEFKKPNNGKCCDENCKNHSSPVYSHGCSNNCHFCGNHYRWTIDFKFCPKCFEKLNEATRPVYDDVIKALSTKRKEYPLYCPQCKEKSLSNFSASDWQCPSCKYWVCHECRTHYKNKPAFCVNIYCSKANPKDKVKDTYIKKAFTGFFCIFPRKCGGCNIIYNPDKDACHMLKCGICSKENPKGKWLCGQCGESSPEEKHTCSNYASHTKIPGSISLKFDKK